MSRNLIKVTPDPERARSILSSTEITLKFINKIDASEFPSNVTKEYYDVIRELMSAVLALDGYKTFGEGAHVALIAYITSNYKEFSGEELLLIEDLRYNRNRIVYDGFSVDRDYVEDNLKLIEGIITKLKVIVKKKLD